MKQELLELKLQGYCCSQIMMELGLRRMGKENKDLIAAMAGLCDGMWMEQTCGILSSAICLLYLADPVEAEESHRQELWDWFTEAFGSDQCHALLGGNPLARADVCPKMLEATFQKVADLLEWED